MKNFVIATNDVLLYLALGVLVVFCLLAVSFAGWFKAIIFFGMGLLVWCVVCGFWFVLSGIHEQLVELNRKTK